VFIDLKTDLLRGRKCRHGDQSGHLSCTWSRTGSNHRRLILGFARRIPDGPNSPSNRAPSASKRGELQGSKPIWAQS